MNLVDEQIAIENAAHVEARARYEKYQIERDPAFVRDLTTNSLLSFMVPKFADLIERWWDPERQVTPHSMVARKSKQLRELALDSIGISIATLRPLFTSLFSGRPTLRTSISIEIAKSIHLENSYKEMEKHNQDKDVFTAYERSSWKKGNEKLLDKMSRQRTSQRVKEVAFARKQFKDLTNLDPAELVKVGSYLIQLLQSMRVRLPSSPEQTSLIESYTITGRGHIKGALRFNAEALSYMNNKNETISASLFTYLPMVVEPTPWDSLYGGGYVTPRGQGVMTMIKARRMSDYESLKIDQRVYDSINAIQATPWQINKEVLAVMSYFDKHGIEAGGLPVSRREFKLPAELPKDEWAQLTKEQKREVKYNRAKIHKEADSQLSKTRAFSLKLSLARRFVNYEKIYFPHTFDFRGRIYPIPAAVNPQSDKFGQALLRFGEGKPLGPTGKTWLGIHGANTFGLDGDNMGVRTAWVRDNTDKIRATASNPIGTREWWGEADEPYSFLAFCFEWDRMHQCASHEDFVSHLPVKLDATSSGLQHYSMMFRDQVGAKATNLMDGDRSDIYLLVAGQVHVVLDNAIMNCKDKEEKQWLRSFKGCINRTICKPPTMCLPYGITLFGATDDMAALWKNKGELASAILPKNTVECGTRIRRFTQMVLEAVGRVVTSAVVGMDWLKKADRAVSKVSKKRLPLYINKLGFPFFQNYMKLKRKRVRMVQGDINIRMDVGITTDERDSNKSNSAIAPNFIHSQDSAHLALVAYEAAKVGMTCFSFIHDSFGVHPSETEAFNAIIRDQFVYLYEDDVLEDLRDQWSQQFPDAKIPEVPKEHYGTFNINEVRRSTYVFN